MEDAYARTGTNISASANNKKRGRRTCPQLRCRGERAHLGRTFSSLLTPLTSSRRTHSRPRLSAFATSLLPGGDPPTRPARIPSCSQCSRPSSVASLFRIAVSLKNVQRKCEPAFLSHLKRSETRDLCSSANLPPSSPADLRFYLLAPCLRRISAISVRRISCATSRGVLPFASFAFRSAPFARRILTISLRLK